MERCSGSAPAPARSATAASSARSAPTARSRGEPREVDLAPVYELLREQVAELNVEGAATMGDRRLAPPARQRARTARTSLPSSHSST